MLYLLQFIVWLLNIFEFMIIIVAIMSWLIAFGVINVYNAGVRAVYDGLNAVLEPMLRPIRRIVPIAGGLDISPLILIVLIELIKQVIIPNLVRALI
ncbi:YggT family protein [Beijerinckiaceae bacterium RH CH11]|nr:YggT family protein [Beijerinckiaceae bacterium]VVB48287.1 YggT family protein [Beijerinckiaceae bacterium RH CH11]VVB48368.1 YggT family protein [Beijerinckiaceae bacterium RH AL8]